MKTLWVLVLLIASTQLSFSQGKQTRTKEKSQKQVHKDSIVMRGNERWEIVSDVVWRGKDSTRYKIKDEKIMEVIGGNTWAEMKDGTWEDYEGNTLKLDGKHVMQSKDNGKTWTRAEENCFKGKDQRTYMVDTNSMVLLRKCL